MNVIEERRVVAPTSNFATSAHDPATSVGLGSLARAHAYSESIDEELGYVGADRFVLIYYEPRIRALKWMDSRRNGSVPGGWPPPLSGIESRARASGISMGGNDEAGDHVVLVDRTNGHARVAFREEAQEFLARRHAATV